MLGVQDPEEGTVTGRLRQEGYRAALIESGLPVLPELERICSGWSPAGGFGAMTALLDEVGVPDAVFCATDSIAIGALSALWSAGVRVPDDVSVVGFDDVDDAAFASPPLTTVRFDKRAYAETAVDRLILRIEGSEAPAERIRFASELVLRASARERAAAR
jgi:DNA-binding LacI/PurR family transcriptional regulator